jgi:glycine hydroxymethyltransferase
MAQSQTMLASLAQDHELSALIDGELRSQQETLNLIAAANLVSSRVQAAMDPRLHNIHAEGYPGRRYHEGQRYADAIEQLAISRAKAVFEAEHANVQPYRGTMANLASTMAVLEPGQTVLGLECRAGGHYTSGTGVHLLGQLFRVVAYSVDPDTHLLDYDLIERSARAERPGVIFCGDTAYPRQWDWERLADIAEGVEATLIADISQVAGLVAGGSVGSPVPYAHVVTFATYKTLRGPRGGVILCRERLRSAIDRAVYPVCQGGPSIPIVAGIAASLKEAATDEFRSYARQVVCNARVLAAELSRRGFELVTGGTDNHAVLIDLRATGTPGNRVARRLAEAGILCNGNQVPFDPGPPRRPSGLRLGTPAVTTLGMTEPEMVTVASLVDMAFAALDDDDSLHDVAGRVREIRRRFPCPEASHLIVEMAGDRDA